MDWIKNEYPKATFLCEVTREMVDKYYGHLKNKLARGTVNKHVRLCKLVVKVFMESEKIQVNPFDHISPMKEVQNHRKEISLEKLCKICDIAEGEMKVLLFIGIYTGLRLGDAVLLQWADVDLVQRWITAVPRKTARHNNNKTIRISIAEALYNMLAATPEGEREGFVLPELSAQYLKSNDNVTDMIQSLFKSCGLQIHKPGTGEESRDASGKIRKRAVLQYGYHSLRHTFVTLQKEAGTPQAVVQEIVGHNTDAMSKRYTHIGDEALKRAAQQIPMIGSTEGAISTPNKHEEEKRSLLIEQIKVLPINVVDQILNIIKELVHEQKTKQN